MKTVKEFNDFSFLELIEYFKDKCNEYDSENKYFLPLTDLNRFELLEEKYKNEIGEKDKELAEKDKEIKRLIEDSKFDIKIGKDLLNEIKQLKQQLDMAHNFNQNLGIEIEELKKQQLYKEDFDGMARVFWTNFM